ncbi:Uncharacterised protein [Salmonella enterica subsp. enterica serovar Bovismorbificans]|uniref:Uncharacterized protein n=1 Tax=Salmonella enterica subsp. enterica serovar Bovismorbificans TaxID=58097 RepID=A0A655EGN4_SALET|nr:Uncharacterised protein [Salmonella enterica subsp. enterica serovar Bovismorbificans]
MAFDNQHHFAFATVFIFFDPRQQLADRRAVNGFPGFGQLTRQHHITGFSQYRDDIFQAI